MTDDLNKQWAELEKWQFLPSKNSVWKRPEPSLSLFVKKLPDWTEPNRFFAEVDKKMNQTHALRLERSNGNRGGWVATYVKRGKWAGEKGCVFCWSDNPCEATLDAAIQARKGLGK